MIVVDGVEMWDVREAALALGRSQETIRRWAWSHRVRSRKQGNRLLIPRADLEREMAGVRSAPAGPSLAEWAVEVRAARRRQGGASGSGASLVIEDRRNRTGS